MVNFQDKMQNIHKFGEKCLKLNWNGAIWMHYRIQYKWKFMNKIVIYFRWKAEAQTSVSFSHFYFRLLLRVFTHSVHNIFEDTRAE